MTSHRKRWVTALAALPALIGIIAYGNLAVFSALIYLVLILALHEFYLMVLGKEHRLARWLGISTASFLYISVYQGDPRVILATASMSVILIFLFFLWQARVQPFAFDLLTRVISGLFYVAFGFSHLIMIRQFPDGISWVFLVLVLAFAGDTLAFYAGKAWGKTKLMPTVSPGKTEAGILGLIAGGVIGTIAFKILFLPDLPVGHALILGFTGSIIGQLGDLCESAIKRSIGVKDSGSILPGHGGILDRIDCLLFIVPFVYYYRLFMLS
ncbi:MAG: phosphatidate cytidylyltransferase [Smithellaceae bacterium]|nr:phosphatidate cytidylyltransferase [Smithellaceae bacterium]